MKIKIASFNCSGFKQKIYTIRKLMQCNDIICLQETLVNESNVDIFNEIDTLFSYFYVNAAKKQSQICGQCSGGLVIYFRKNLKHLIELFTCSDRIWVNEGISKYLIVNCYVPCDYINEESIIEYRETIAKLANILENENFKEICFVGNFNANPASRFYCELLNLKNSYNLKIVDIDTLPRDSFIYISPCDHKSMKWIDHFLTSSNEINNIKIHYVIAFYDLIPMSLQYDMIYVNYREDCINEKNFEFVLWDKITEQDIDIYKENILYLCEEYICDALLCSDLNCKNIEHINELESVYEYAVEALFIASSHFLICKSKNKFKKVAGWNDHCLQLHNDFLKWKENLKCRYGIHYEKMKKI